MIANGFLMGDALAAVAKRFPKTNFAIVDFPWVALKGKPKNVRGLIFRENEAGYLAGVAAATVAKGQSRQLRRRPGCPGGRRVPRRLQGGREGDQEGHEGALRLLRGLRRPGEVQGDRAQPDRPGLQRRVRGRRRLRPRCASGGQGEAGVWGIGVDNDQAFLGKHILTSATKKVDFAVFTTIQQVLNDAFKGGTDGVFTVKNGGVGFGTVSTKAPGRAALIKKLTAVSTQIAKGKIKIPSK